MSVQEGLEPKAVRAAGERIESLGKQVSGIQDDGNAMLKVLAAVWEGPDLGTFESGWSEAGPQVAQAAETLRAAGAELRRQAEDQIRVSDGEGSRGGGGGGWGWPDWDLPDFDFPDLNPFDGWDWDLPDIDWPTLDVSAFLDGAWDDFLDLLEDIGDWWDDIPWWGQLIIGVVAVVIGVVVAIFLGLEVLAALAAVALVVGIVMTFLDIADALAEFFRDPEAFIQKVLDDPWGALENLIWFGVGLIPFGIGKVLQRLRKPFRELVENAAPWLKKKWDELAAWGKKTWDDIASKTGLKLRELDDRLHGRPHPGSPVSRGREYTGTGTGRGKNAFPKQAGPNEVLYRTDGNGKVTYYQEYGPDGLPTKRVDIDPNSKSHAGVPPPHVQEYTRVTNPKTGETYVKKSPTVRPATPEEVHNL
ncbi:polymorphic toxin type 24 domain-containing protein [Janibacter indicus]